MVNDSIDNLRLDINKPKSRVSLSVRKGDTKTRTIHIALTSNGAVYSLENALMAELLITKPDGKVCDQDMVIKGNELQYTFRTQDTNVVGECVCQVRLMFKDGAYLISPQFYMYVYTMILDTNTSKSENEYSQTDALLSKANEYYENASKLAEDVEQAKLDSATSATEAGNYASESQSYYLNAQSYAESAEDSKDAALEAKTDAIAAATSANTQAGLASGYATSSKTYKDAAVKAKDDAEQIKTDVSNYTTHAAAYAKAAESFAHGATGSRTGENTDNSMYYSSLALNYANNAKQNADKLEAQIKFMNPVFRLDSDGFLYVDINPQVNLDFRLDTDCLLYWDQT